MLAQKLNGDRCNNQCGNQLRPVSMDFDCKSYALTLFCKRWCHVSPFFIFVQQVRYLNRRRLVGLGKPTQSTKVRNSIYYKVESFRKTCMSNCYCRVKKGYNSTPYSSNPKCIELRYIQNWVTYVALYFLLPPIRDSDGYAQNTYG